MTTFTLPTETQVFTGTTSYRKTKGARLKINKDVFNENLSKTQAYCDWRMDDKSLDNATVFRSFNPVSNGRNLFEFQDNQYSAMAQAMNQSEWTTNPLEENTIEQLYADQLANKDKFEGVALPNQFFKGDIIVSKIDLTLLDGASEFQSLGFFDTYDIAPIDTWFYMTKFETSRLIFSWVPQQYKPRVNQAILVNCVDCLGWFSEWFPNESQEVLALD